ncbi:DUF2283 domain-containing protein [uncultured Methanobrevibacter sp.]|uniref:DUF2283 domain-containing protein n=1 Tax=uncultured Methanobrevibacter sp. TaxID=253161 RepID=UPI0025D514FF|nr:DUF2283 domain-containing protein [uncultured Methanobrevibacter sp.]
MKTKQMISSYDEINDTFVAKISDKDGYYANYDIADGIFLNIDKNGFPVSVHINNASDVLNVEKGILKNPDVSILIECIGDKITFTFSIADRVIFSNMSFNIFEMPEISYKIKAN